MTRFTSLASIGGALARVSVGVVVVVKCVAATKQRLHSRCLECPLDCGRLVGSCSADGVRHRQRGSLRASLERLDRAIDTEARLRRLRGRAFGHLSCPRYCGHGLWRARAGSFGRTPQALFPADDYRNFSARFQGENLRSNLNLAERLRASAIAMHATPA